MSTPRPAFCVVVLGGDAAPPEYVAAKLDALTAPVAPDHIVCVVVRGDEGDHAALWAQAGDHRSVTVEPELPGLYGRHSGARWAMAVVAVARLVVIFGDDRRWWRVCRYAGDAGVQVVRVPVPAGCVPPAAAQDRPRDWRRVPAADPLSQPRVLDGAGPGGWPD